MRRPKYYTNILDTCLHQHLSAEEIYTRVKTIEPTIGRATVYRNIEDMSQKGLLRKLPNLSGKMYYEARDIPHAHLVDGENHFSDFPLENIHLTNMPTGYIIEELRITLRKI